MYDKECFINPANTSPSSCLECCPCSPRTQDAKLRSAIIHHISPLSFKEINLVSILTQHKDGWNKVELYDANLHTSNMHMAHNHCTICCTFHICVAGSSL